MFHSSSTALIRRKAPLSTTTTAGVDQPHSTGKSSIVSGDLKLFVRDVRGSGRKRAVTVRAWATIQQVKEALSKLLHVPSSAQHLYFGPLLTAELPNHRTLADAGIYRSGATLLLDIYGAEPPALTASRRVSTGHDIVISSSMIDSTPRLLKQVVQHCRRGLALGYRPAVALDGSGGTYFLHDARKHPVAVFKPADEEPYAPNNPRGYLPQPGQDLSLRQGIKPGEACIREVAAYLLDHGGFAGVPMTTLSEARHPAFNYHGSHLKVAEGGAAMGSHSLLATPSPSHLPNLKAGSLQEFVDHECTMDDMSPSKIPDEAIHRIAILDIRIMNADRNSANLLCRRRPDGTLTLVPIDHGYCLRSQSDVSWMDWVWLDWPQLKQVCMRAQVTRLFDSCSHTLTLSRSMKSANNMF
jgi:phosphatidylinositol 4-kinase type 2